MNHNQFKKITQEQINKCLAILEGKKQEYANDEDRLYNFRQPSSLLGMCPAEVAFCYDSKHIASIQKIVHEMSKGKLPTKELWQEKITDYLNYGLLMNACVMELLEDEN